ncbi:uncharacterized protein METZ01_LOCUS392968 [marine metagenome]|uniref:Uncharacterized protein n=1 Tax=marine metagenome TaxID=408172 RepID=A0A382V0U6_9ZZZZ
MRRDPRIAQIKWFLRQSTTSADRDNREPGTTFMPLALGQGESRRAKRNSPGSQPWEHSPQLSSEIALGQQGRPSNKKREPGKTQKARTANAY